jgi:hypothetical protein
VGTSNFVYLELLSNVFLNWRKFAKKEKFKIQKSKNQVMWKVFNRQKLGEKFSKKSPDFYI